MTTDSQAHACPQCANTLLEKYFEGEYGVPFQVEQCTACGGVWFEKYKHYRVQKEHLETLDPLSEEAFTNISAVGSVPLLCPKDGATLVRFVDATLPDDLIIESCQKCAGMWFNRGQLRTLHRHRETVREKYQGTKEEKRAPQSALVHAFLDIQHNHERQDKISKSQKAIANEGLRSLVAFALSNPSAGRIHPIGAVIPLAFLLYRLLSIGGARGVLHVDMGEFRKMIEEMQIQAEAEAPTATQSYLS